MTVVGHHGSYQEHELLLHVSFWPNLWPGKSGGTEPEENRQRASSQTSRLDPQWSGRHAILEDGPMLGGIDVTEKSRKKNLSGSVPVITRTGRIGVSRTTVWTLNDCVITIKGVTHSTSCQAAGFHHRKECLIQLKLQCSCAAGQGSSELG